MRGGIVPARSAPTAMGSSPTAGSGRAHRDAGGSTTTPEHRAPARPGDRAARAPGAGSSRTGARPGINGTMAALTGRLSSTVILETIVSVECGGEACLLRPDDPEQPYEAGDVVAYRQCVGYAVASTS